MSVGVRVATVLAVLSAVSGAHAQQPAEPPPCPPGEFCTPVEPTAPPAEAEEAEEAPAPAEPAAPPPTRASPAVIVEQRTTPLPSESPNWNASGDPVADRDLHDDDDDAGDALFAVGAASFLTGYVPALVTAAWIETERDLAEERGEPYYDGGWSLLALPFEGPWIAALVQEANPTQWGLSAASSALQHAGLLLMIVGAVIEPDDSSDVAVTVAPMAAGPGGGGLSVVGVW